MKIIQRGYMYLSNFSINFDICRLQINMGLVNSDSNSFIWREVNKSVTFVFSLIREVV